MADGDEAQPKGNKIGDLRYYARFWPFLQPYKSWIGLSFFLLPLMVLTDLAQPWILKLAIDDHIAKGDLSGLPQIAGALFGLVIAAYFLGAAQVYYLQLAGLKALGDTRRAIYRHVMNQGSRFFDRHPSGSLLTRTTTDVESLGETLTMGVVSIFGDILMIVGIVVAMLLLDVKLTLLTFAVSPLLVLVVNIFRRKLREYSVVIRKSLSKVNGYLAENLAGLKVVQLFGREDKSLSEFRTLSYEYMDAFRKSNWYEASLYAIMDGVSNLCVALMLWYGGLRAVAPEHSGVLTVGLLVAFIEYITRVFVPIREFSGKLATLQRAVAALERIFGLLDTHNEIGMGKPEWNTHEFTGSIRFENVSFAYNEKGPQVLNGISFLMEPGKVVALVGSTGSGKTTIGKLLLRLYDGYHGSIEIDGVPLKDIPSDRVHRIVGVVQQDVFLFSGTVRDNISLKNPDISPAQVEEAAKLVGAHDFIQSLPNRYDTLIAERGANLSAGQAQLLSFARAMAHNSPVMLLDEATANIDSLSEQLIQQAIARILALKTVLIVAHRLSTIQQADEILVLQKGVIVERGKHAELVNHGGVYAELAKSNELAGVTNDP
ncbi:MAG: ABC transporter ATP-binding protein [Myxococcales bacterium]|nr:ABC transporter ATP-binding protein [Myxococcales bacterium]